MMRVKVKANKVRLSIPIPYALFNIAISILSSKRFQRNVNRWISDHYERTKKEVPFTFPQIDKQTLKPFAKELKKHKGLVLVDVKAKDGSEVLIRL
ncbi:hypothetical protein UACE39S_05861 [Ureibacillus acetophenoni]